MSRVFVSYSPVYVHAVPDGHKFPMEKYNILYQQLLYEGLMNEEEFLNPEKIDTKFVLPIHDNIYVSKLENLQCTPREQRISGFEHTTALIDREFRIMEGTRKLVELACGSMCCGLNIAGGTHHAFSERGEGFCLLNDLAIGAKYAIDYGGKKAVLIIDLDVHQGNGTAKICKERQAIFTFSMHGKNNYPLHKEKSDLDVELDDGCSGIEYLEKLKTALMHIENKFKPDLVLYQCGVDVLATDKLGKLNLSVEDCKERDRLVFEFAKQHACSIVCAMGGGYSESLRIIVDAHMNTFRLAYDMFSA